MSDNPIENHRNFVCAVSILLVPLTRQIWWSKNRFVAKNSGTKYKACHCTLSGAPWVQSTSYPICLRLYLLVCIIHLSVLYLLDMGLVLFLCRKLQILFLRRFLDKVCDQRHVRRKLCGRCDCGHTNDAVRLHVRAETHVQSLN